MFIYNGLFVTILFDKGVIVIAGSSPPSIIHEIHYAQNGYIDTHSFYFRIRRIYWLLLPLCTFWVTIRRFPVDFTSRSYIDNCICSFSKIIIFDEHWFIGASAFYYHSRPTIFFSSCMDKATDRLSWHANKKSKLWYWGSKSRFAQNYPGSILRYNSVPAYAT